MCLKDVPELFLLIELVESDERKNGVNLCTKDKTPPSKVGFLVEVTGLEPAASWSQTKRPTNWATPRIFNCQYIIQKRQFIVNEFQILILSVCVYYRCMLFGNS